MVPVLEPQFARLGLFEPGAADIDVNALHQGFIRGLKQRGSRLECGVQIHSIERSGGEWLLEVAMRGAQPHTLRAPLVIDAAGAWADEVAALAGVAPLGIEPRRRSAFLFQPPEGVATAHWPFVTSVAEDFYFKPDAGLLLGSPANADPVRPHDVQAEELDIAMAIDRIERATTMRIRTPDAALGGPALLRCRRWARGWFRSRGARFFLGRRARWLRHSNLRRDGRSLRTPRVGPRAADASRGRRPIGGDARGRTRTKFVMSPVHFGVPNAYLDCCLRLFAGSSRSSRQSMKARSAACGWRRFE